MNVLLPGKKGVAQRFLPFFLKVAAKEVTLAAIYFSLLPGICQFFISANEFNIKMKIKKTPDQSGVKLWQFNYCL
jgi:hypothetical protein